MKRIFVIILSGLSLAASAQSKKFILKAESLFNPDLQLLYVGVPNSVSIANNTDTNVFLGITDGRCTKFSRNKNGVIFYIDVPNGCNETTVQILKKTLKDTLLMDTAHFTVLRIPFPKAVFGNLTDTVATVEALMLQKRINIFLPCYYILGFHVVSFSLKILRFNGIMECRDTRGDYIMPAYISIIRSLKPGDTLIIDDIICRGAASSDLKLQPIKIKVIRR